MSAAELLANGEKSRHINGIVKITYTFIRGNQDFFPQYLQIAPNFCVEALTPNVMVVGGGAFGK
jgi:hypothetical protein